MKTHLNYSQINNINNNMLLRKNKHIVQENSKNITRENKEQLRPARAISFGGSAALTKAFTKTVEFVNDNEAAYNAIYAMIVAGFLKPLFVLNMPGSEEKDKQIVATKNALQAFIGAFLGLTIGGGFVKKAIDVVNTNLNLIKEVDDNNKIITLKENSAKALELAKEQLRKEGKKNPTIDEIIKKSKDMLANFNKNHKHAYENNPKFLKEILSGAGNKTTYKDASNILWKNSTGALTAIMKAKVSSILLPGVMAFLFAKKNLEKERLEKARQNTLTNNSSFKTQQEQFQKMMNKTNPLSFKGNMLSSAIDGAATIVEHASMSKVGEKLTKALAKTQKPSARMSDIESFIITGYWLQNTARSKKIEPSQKLGLNVHSALVTIVSSTAAFIIDWALDGIIGKSERNYKEKLENIAENIKKNYTIGENLDNVLEGDNITPAIKMGIKDEVVALLDKKATKDGFKEITSAEIKGIADRLNSTETFKNSGISKNHEQLIEKAVETLKKTEPIRKELTQQCENMIGSKDIIKNLSIAIGNNDATTKAIKDLTKKYGKKLSKFKSLTIFTLVVRFLVPVLMVPFSGKLKKKIVEWTSSKNNDNKTQKS